MKFIKIYFAVFCICICTYAFSEDKVKFVNIDKTNCSKVNGVTKGIAELFAQKFQMNPNDVDLMRAEYGRGVFGGEDCMGVFAYPKGIVKCSLRCGIERKKGKISAHSCMSVSNEGEVSPAYALICDQ